MYSPIMCDVKCVSTKILYHKYSKSQGIMKTFTQFSEDVNRLEQRRKQLRQRQLDQVQAYKNRAAAYRERIQKQRSKRQEKEQLKQELKRELKDT